MYDGQTTTGHPETWEDNLHYTTEFLEEAV